jgi:pimeloyl-ACP methyl ester carboxylesterase
MRVVGFCLESIPGQAVASISSSTTYHTISVDGVNVFYRDSLYVQDYGGPQIQSDLFYDYRTNVAAYPAWQAWMRQRQPPMLVLWGKYDPSFVVAGAAAYQRDVPGAEVHVLEAGHFALDEKADEIAVLMRAFLDKHP